jgi:hypothetical protein
MSRLAATASALLLVLFSAGAPFVAAAQPRVRLLVSVADADAYERTMALVAGGRLTALDGEAFVVVGDFADARQGYSFGRALQRRLKLPFELLYEPGHPQANLAWARQPSLASKPNPNPQSRPPQPQPRAPLLRGDLVYLYAVPQHPIHRERVAQLLPRQIANPGLERIRVGVFRRTPTGLRLLAAKQKRLDRLAVPYEQLQLDPIPPATKVASAQPALAPVVFQPGPR